MLTLREFIETADPKRPHREWAQIFGISRSHLTEILNDQAFPGRKTIARIAVATDGRVPPSIWYRERAV